MAMLAGAESSNAGVTVIRRTGIGWTEYVWSLWGGCVPESSGCLNCYAVYSAWRLGHNPLTPNYAGLVDKGANGILRWSGKVALLAGAREAPLGWKRPGYVFVSSMTDAFLPRVPRAWKVELWATMVVGDWHTYQVLTKHAQELLAWCVDPPLDEIATVASAMATAREGRPVVYDLDLVAPRISDGIERRPLPWPLPHVMVGVSVETAELAARRLPVLSQTPAAWRWFSGEPLLERIPFRGLLTGISLGILGGESERKRGRARRCDTAWIRSGIEDLHEVNAAAYVKQLGAVWAREQGLRGKGEDTSQWSADLRVQEMPQGLRLPAPKRSLPILNGTA